MSKFTATVTITLDEYIRLRKNRNAIGAINSFREKILGLFGNQRELTIFELDKLTREFLNEIDWTEDE